MRCSASSCAAVRSSVPVILRRSRTIDQRVCAFNAVRSELSSRWLYAVKRRPVVAVIRAERNRSSSRQVRRERRDDESLSWVPSRAAADLSMSGARTTTCIERTANADSPLNFAACSCATRMMSTHSVKPWSSLSSSSSSCSRCSDEEDGNSTALSVRRVFFSVTRSCTSVSGSMQRPDSLPCSACRAQLADWTMRSTASADNPYCSSTISLAFEDDPKRAMSSRNLLALSLLIASANRVSLSHCRIRTAYFCGGKTRACLTAPFRLTALNLQNSLIGNTNWRSARPIATATAASDRKTALDCVSSASSPRLSSTANGVLLVSRVCDSSQLVFAARSIKATFGCTATALIPSRSRSGSEELLLPFSSCTCAARQ
mmetsp:Transcript_11015/g.23613  ORF Transcript_11015/g.23613 Transcript_11015/m.23613 type:complete len:374 (-) Transcript_11015:111-1232(-)